MPTPTLEEGVQNLPILTLLQHQLLYSRPTKYPVSFQLRRDIGNIGAGDFDVFFRFILVHVVPGPVLLAEI